MKLQEGGYCAAAAIERSGYVYSDCEKITNHRQDRCAAQSIERSGYVTSDCFKL